MPPLTPRHFAAGSALQLLVRAPSRTSCSVHGAHPAMLHHGSSRRRHLSPRSLAALICAGLSAAVMAVLSPATKDPLPDEASGAGAGTVGSISRHHIDVALRGVQCPPQENAAEVPAALLRTKVGCALFERIDWRSSAQSRRQRALLIFLACRSHAPKAWWWQQLLGPAGMTLLATELPEELFENLMQAPWGCRIARGCRRIAAQLNCGWRSVAPARTTELWVTACSSCSHN